MRKLVTVRKVSAIHPIEGADFVELIQVDGWQCIAKKGEFTPGSPCVYFEIDSFLPAESRYEFLKKQTTYLGSKGYRIKTMKMRGVISQGLALPLKMFQELAAFEYDTDYSDLLGVIKYDVSVTNSQNIGKLQTGNTKGNFPSFIPKTDQPRIQNLTSYFSIYADHCFEETLKLDGSSMTCYKVTEGLPKWKSIVNNITEPWGFKTLKPKDHFGVCSRNLEIKPTETYSKTSTNGTRESVYSTSDFWTAALKYKLDKELPPGYAVQGELIGPKIQANHEKVTDLEFYIFDVYDIKAQRYLLPQERISFVTMQLPSARHVPVKNASYPIFKYLTDITGLLDYVEGESMNPNTISEGRVYKSTSVPGLTFKAISNQYLLKSET